MRFAVLGILGNKSHPRLLCEFVAHTDSSRSHSRDEVACEAGKGMDISQKFRCDSMDLILDLVVTRTLPQEIESTRVTPGREGSSETTESPRLGGSLHG